MKMLLLVALLPTLDAGQQPTSGYAIWATGSSGKPSSLLKGCLYRHIPARTGRALQAGMLIWSNWSRASVFGPLKGAFAPGHHGYPRTSDLIRVKALEGRMCHQITDATVRPFLHLLNLARRPRRESPRFCSC